MASASLLGAPAQRTVRLAALAAERLAGHPAGELLAAAAADGDAAGPDEGAPFTRLSSALRLSPFEEDLVLLAGLPEEHESAAAALRLLHPRGEPWATAGLAGRLLCASAAERALLRHALEEGPLGRAGVFVADPGVPHPEVSLRLAPRLWSALHDVDGAWPPGCRPLPVPPTAGLETWLEARGAGVDTARKALADGGPRVVLVTAADPEEAAARAVALVTAESRRPVVVPASGVDDERAPLWSLHALVRGAVPVVVATGDEEPAPTLSGHPGPVVVCARPGARVAADARPVLSVATEPLDLDDRASMWRRLLPDHDADHLAGLMRVEAAHAQLAAGDVLDRGRLEGHTAGTGAVAASVRLRTGLRLPSAVRLVRPRAGWDRLVLPDAHAGQLRDAVSRARHQVQVLQRWGFERGRPGAGGVRMLFSGPPGTGKTLAAEVMAAALGIDLLSVDLAALVSKWLGETEKNLAAVFDAAERSQAVLFFDEADAVFGRRTEVSDAQSRWANLETAYLLGRLEQFEGVAVLATNLRANVDAAFVRRLDFVIEFPEPDRADRERLWGVHLPVDAPLDADVDVGALARLYPVTGGTIRNAALAAAFTAAGDGEVIGQRHFVAAMRREYAKAGRSFPGTPRRSNVNQEVEPCPAT